MKSRILVGFGIAAIALTGSGAAAQSSSGEWQYNIAPYLWAAGMDGAITVKGVEADVDVPFSDVISDLDFAAMVHFDMKNERWVVSSDLIYVDLGSSTDVAQGTVTATVTQTLFEVVGGYRLSPAITLLVGGRWVDLSSGLKYSGSNVGDSVEAGKSWIDPIVGVHLIAPLAKRWWIGVHGDIGGFGVGSDLAWQAYADVGFRASDLVSVILGYRAIDMDYEDGSGRDLFRYDMLISGPQIGVAFTF